MTDPGRLTIEAYDAWLEMRSLEGILETPHCESEHSYPGNRTCSHVPVARIRTTLCRDNVPGTKVCLMHVMSAQSRVAGEFACAGCREEGRDERASDCWRIEPL